MASLSDQGWRIGHSFFGQASSVAQSEYARLAGMSPAALTAAMEPCLPILRAFALRGPAKTSNGPRTNAFPCGEAVGKRA